MEPSGSKEIGMSESTIVSSGKKGYVASAAMSFMGMLAAVPVVMMLVASNAPASAAPNTTSDYDKFAYAYTQGYLANAGDVTTENMDACGLPVGGMGSVGDMHGSGAAAITDGAVAVSGSFVPGKGNVGGSGHAVLPEELMQEIHESYNTYHYNYVNSNNSIGSNNSTSTSVAVSDSENVHIDTENTTDISNDVENNSAIDSFNEEVTNTTNTSIAVDDSFNEVDIDDSGNTVTETENETEETNTTIVTTINESFNTVEDGPSFPPVLSEL
jgi:hypothetical protein